VLAAGRLIRPQERRHGKLDMRRIGYVAVLRRVGGLFQSNNVRRQRDRSVQRVLFERAKFRQRIERVEDEGRAAAMADILHGQKEFRIKPYGVDGI
jgi:hypothetical protein